MANFCSHATSFVIGVLLKGDTTSDFVTLYLARFKSRNLFRYFPNVALRNSLLALTFLIISMANPDPPVFFIYKIGQSDFHVQNGRPL